MKKWDGQPSWTLEGWIQELHAKNTAKRHPSRKIAAPVSVEQGRRHNFDADEGTSGLQLQNSSNKYSNLEQRGPAFARRRKGRTGFAGKCEHHVNTYQRYETPHKKPIVQYDLSRLDPVASFSSSDSV